MRRREQIALPGYIPVRMRIFLRLLDQEKKRPANRHQNFVCFFLLQIAVPNVRSRVIRSLGTKCPTVSRTVERNGAGTAEESMIDQLGKTVASSLRKKGTPCVQLGPIFQQIRTWVGSWHLKCVLSSSPSLRKMCGSTQLSTDAIKNDPKQVSHSPLMTQNLALMPYTEEHLHVRRYYIGYAYADYPFWSEPSHFGSNHFDSSGRSRTTRVGFHGLHLHGSMEQKPFICGSWVELPPKQKAFAESRCEMGNFENVSAVNLAVPLGGEGSWKASSGAPHVALNNTSWRGWKMTLH